MPEWTFITSHGLVLTHIARYPQTTAREIAQAIDLTERTVHKIITDLDTEGYVDKQRVGRNNVYRVCPHLGLRAETADAEDVEVGDLLKVLGWRRCKTSSGDGATTTPK